jgi:cobalt-zinc-cadmium efflux system outer membrane protein
MKYAFLATALGALLTAVTADAAPMTFDAALSAARTHAPSLEAKRLGKQASQAARTAAGALPDPKLSLGIDSFPISGPLAFKPSQDNFTWVKIGVSQEIPNPAKRRAQRSRAESDIAAAEADVALDARTVEVETGVAWIKLAFAEQRLAVVDKLRIRLDRLVRTTPSAVAAGTARPAQTLAGRQSLAELDDRREDLIAEIGRARAELNRWTGEIHPGIAGALPSFAVDPTNLRASLDENPLLAPVEARIGQASADVRLAEAERKSDFGVDAAYQHRDPRFGDYVSAGVTISLPFFTRSRQNAGIAARQAQAGQAVAEREAARRALATNLEAGLADHAMHHEQWQRSRLTLEPLARERVELETASYGAGRASLVDVVDAHVALINAALTTLDREALVEIDGAKLVLTYRSAAR